jgi:LacI family transcriptional regulator
LSIQKVAQLAGVSISTVSRVINAHPSVSPETLKSVRQAIVQLGFRPAKRRPVTTRTGTTPVRHRTATIAFLVFGTTGAAPAPAFSRLLQGVSGSVNSHGLGLVFGFASDLTQIPRTIREREVDGVLVHGELPSPAVQARLKGLPTVWLMANRQRPTWGDQVLPENTVVGELAAKYLLGRGHRKLAYVGTPQRAWYLGIRSLSFRTAAEEVGASVRTLLAPERSASDLWQGDGLPEAAEALADQIAGLPDGPTGLFVAEDRLLPALYGALSRRGIHAGSDLDIVSCNNEQPHLFSLQPAPATIDLRTEAIGRCGVERLLWRMEHPQADRARMMIEPLLVEPRASERQDFAGAVAAGVPAGISEILSDANHF